MTRQYLRNFSKAVFSALILSGFCLPASAQQATSQQAAAVSALEEILSQTQTFSAEVEQLFIDQDGRELQETRGMLLMEKPAWSASS